MNKGESLWIEDRSGSLRSDVVDTEVAFKQLGFGSRLGSPETESEPESVGLVGGEVVQATRVAETEEYDEIQREVGAPSYTSTPREDSQVTRKDLLGDRSLRVSDTAEHDTMPWPPNQGDQEAPLYRSFSEIPSLRGRDRGMGKRGRSASPAPFGITRTTKNPYYMNAPSQVPRTSAFGSVPSNIGEDVTGWKVNIEQQYYASSRSRSVSPAVKLQMPAESHDMFASPEPVPAGNYDQVYSQGREQEGAIGPSVEPNSPLVPHNTPESDSPPTLYQATDKQGDPVKPPPRPATYGEAYQNPKRAIPPKPRLIAPLHEPTTKRATRLDSVHSELNLSSSHDNNPFVHEPTTKRATRLDSVRGEPNLSSSQDNNPFVHEYNTKRATRLDSVRGEPNLSSSHDNNHLMHDPATKRATRLDSVRGEPNLLAQHDKPPLHNPVIRQATRLDSVRGEQNPLHLHDVKPTLYNPATKWATRLDSVRGEQNLFALHDMKPLLYNPATKQATRLDSVRGERDLFKQNDAWHAQEIPFESNPPNDLLQSEHRPTFPPTASRPDAYSSIPLSPVKQNKPTVTFEPVLADVPPSEWPAEYTPQRDPYSVREWPAEYPPQRDPYSVRERPTEYPSQGDPYFTGERPIEYPPSRNLYVEHQHTPDTSIHRAQRVTFSDERMHSPSTSREAMYGSSSGPQLYSPESPIRTMPLYAPRAYTPDLAPRPIPSSTAPLDPCYSSTPRGWPRGLITQSLEPELPRTASAPPATVDRPESPVASSNRKPSRIREPPKFTGKTDVHDFLSQFELVRKYNRWSEYDAGFELACSLDEDARELCSTLPEAESCNYKNLREALRNRFAPPGNESRHVVHLFGRVMQKGETVAAYGGALRKLARDVYPRNPLGPHVLVGLFIKGLRDKDLQRHVHMGKPQNLEEAINLASTCEAFDEAPVGNEKKKSKPEFTGKVKTENKSTGGDCGLSC